MLQNMSSQYGTAVGLINFLKLWLPVQFLHKIRPINIDGVELMRQKVRLSLA